jgi:hypothetical protein
MEAEKPDNLHDSLDLSIYGETGLVEMGEL